MKTHTESEPLHESKIIGATYPDLARAFLKHAETRLLEGERVAYESDGKIMFYHPARSRLHGMLVLYDGFHHGYMAGLESAGVLTE